MEDWNEPKWRRWPEMPADAVGSYVISDHGRCFVGMVIGPKTTPPGLTDGLLWYGPLPDVPDELLPDQFKSMPTSVKNPFVATARVTATQR